MQLDNMKSAWAQYATYLLWIGLFSFMMLSFKDFGITGDEVTQQAYGESVYNYYKRRFEFIIKFDFSVIISHVDSMRDMVDNLIEVNKINGFSQISHN